MKAGSNFSILYDNLYAAKIDSVVLAGPYNRLSLTIDSVVIGRIEYDPYTKQSVNNTIWVQVPESAPEELYDLFVHCGGEVHLSSRSVKVVRYFNSSHSFIHISDLHISRQWVGTAEDGYARELELKLTLNYKNSNYGICSENEALIRNFFDTGFPRCKIRFVMERGNYKVSGGIIHQKIETDKLSVIDVFTEVYANSEKKVKVSLLK